MKIGTIRRIDDLGRIVLPKGIRQNLRIKSGDNLEIFIENNDIILRKYSQLNQLIDIENTIASVLKETLKADVLITDKDKYIIINGIAKQKYLNREISDEILKILENRQMIIKENESILFTKNEKESGNIVINPIIINGDVIGSIIVITKEKIDESKIKTISILTTFLTKHIE